MTRRGRLLWSILLAALVAGALVAAVTLGQLPWGRLYPRLLRPLLTLTLAIGVGLFLGMVIEAAGLTARLGRLTMPLLRFGHLREPSALACTAAFVSAISASTILMNAYREQKISRQELTISALILTFPTFFAHLPTMFFTITPLLGALGIYYLAILLAGDVLRTLAYLSYGRLRLPRHPPAHPPAQTPAAAATPSLREIWMETREKFLARLHNILVITIPVYVAVFLAQEFGLFEALRHSLTSVLQGTQIPVQALGILLFSLAAETTGGYAAAGAILEAGALSPAAVLLTLLLGTILASPMRAVRHQLPYYLGVFAPGLGLRLMVLSQVFRTLSLLPFLALIYFFWL
ncbi:MAG: nucleoside recognition protein [Pseudomonadota bacterium]